MCIRHDLGNLDERLDEASEIVLDPGDDAHRREGYLGGSLEAETWSS